MPVNSIKKQVAELQGVSRLRTRESADFIVMMDTCPQYKKQKLTEVGGRISKGETSPFCSVFTLASTEFCSASIY
jgi:hypothetical protein